MEAARVCRRAVVLLLLLPGLALPSLCRAGSSRQLKVRGDTKALVKAIAKTAVKRPPPALQGPRKPMTIVIGNKPSYWALGVQDTFTMPRVHKGDTLVFQWTNDPSMDPPHDVWLMDSSTSYTYCVFDTSKPLRAPLPAGNLKYKITQKPGTWLYFACGVTYHCFAGMKIAVRVWQ